MRGYVKLFGSLLTSSIWCQDKDTKIVWITMLALADQDGVVEGSVPGLARQADVEISECEAALETLLSPDPYSRSTEHEGRRIERVPGGWRLLNYARYREKAQNKDGSRAPYMREYREKLKSAERAEESRVAEDVTRNNENTKDADFLSPNVTRNTEERREKQITEQQPRARERSDDPLPKNPLVDRQPIINRGNTAIVQIAKLVDLDPVQILAKASTGFGKLMGARSVRLDTMSDDHLAQTVLDLEAWLARLQLPTDGDESPPCVEVDEKAVRLVGLVTERLRETVPEHTWATWFRPLSGVEVTAHALRVLVPDRHWLEWLPANYAVAMQAAMEGAGVGHLTIDLVTRDALVAEAVSRRRRTA